MKVSLIKVLFLTALGVFLIPYIKCDSNENEIDEDLAFINVLTLEEEKQE